MPDATVKSSASKATSGGTVQEVDVAVVGAGFAGLYLLHRLRKAGFTTVVGVDFGPDGLLYALELSDAAGYPAAGNGKVVRVLHSGEIEDVVTGLAVPTGMTFGPDGALYVSNLGAVPAGAAPATVGQILRVHVTPGW